MLDMLALKSVFKTAAPAEPAAAPAEGEKNESVQVIHLPLEKIMINPEQPRKVFCEEELEELSRSIQEYGVLQPILVRKMENGFYSIIAGERRYRASQLAGKITIPVIIRNLEEEEAALIALVEKENLPCYVSLEERMGCGIGACLVCVCDLTNGKKSRVCKDGPVFNSKSVVL